MNRTLKILLIAYGVAAMQLTACHKSDNKVVSINTINSSTGANTLNGMFDGLHGSFQNFTVTAGTAKKIKASNGTQLSFYPNSFKDADGNILSNTTVNIQITEMYAAGQAIENGMTTIANDRMFGCAGQLYIKASANGKEVFANKYGIGFKAAAASTQSMNLYYANTNNAGPFVTWTPVTSAPGTVSDGTTIDSFTILTIDPSGTNVDTMTFRTNYNRFDSCSSFNKISCGYFLASNGVTTNVTVKPSNPVFNNSNTVVYLHFPGTNSLTTLNDYNSVNNSFGLSAGYEVPVGTKADLVILSSIGTSYYFYLQTGINISNGMNFTPVLSPASITQIQTTLLSL